MKNPIRRFYEFLETPIQPGGRIAVALATALLFPAFLKPLWTIELRAPQYPQGLFMWIYLYKIEGGDGGRHIDEINTLNHYIGMHRITANEFPDLGWIPFAIGALILISFRVAAIGNVRALLDLGVIHAYFTCFAFGRFVYQLYRYGHDLDPTAPIDIDPFMPVIIGSKQIANFTTHSYPSGGSYFVGAFTVLIWATLAWHLIAGRREAARKDAIADANLSGSP